ncbi:alkaline phosphatase family protein [candidate division CSSED10-310 bacterium]|uniref:Alkaline phosphatase family protein n=1 Tax=candidate division CSSED10-310 bacterium TaxID=2855610 RepID=A0ABV6Z036_UNCC1
MKWFKENNVFDLMLFLCCAVSGLILLFSYRTVEEPLPVSGRIVLLGIDGLSWTPLLPLLKAGKMPHLAAVMQQGSYGDMKTSPPDRSPQVWTTIATGVKVEKHNIATRYLLDKGKKRITLSSDWLFPPLWSYLSLKKIPTLVVGWPVSYPSSPLFGINISDLFFPPWGNFKKSDLEEIKNRSFPSSFSDTITGIKPLLELSGAPVENAGVHPDLREIFHKSRHSDLMNASLARYSFRKYNPGVTLIYLGGFYPLMKSACHETGSAPVDVGPEIKRFNTTLKEEYRSSVEAYLMFLDRLIGLFQQVQHPEDTFMIVSGRGLVPGSIDDVINDPDVSLPLGIFTFQGPVIKSFNRPILGGALEITPTILYLLDIPLDLAMDGGVMMLAIKETLSFHRKVRFKSYAPVFQPPTQ